MNSNDSAVVGEIDSALVRRLIAAQFPQWADLPVRPVSSQGWDNRTFRLGDEMAVRLPSHRRYVTAVEKEHAWLPRLAPHLPLPIPAPLAVGAPGEGYAWRWSVNRWLAGETAGAARIDDRPRFATDLAAFLAALQRIEAADGPPAGPHSFWRGGLLATYDAETRAVISALGDRIDGAAATAVWDAALATRLAEPPVVGARRRRAWQPAGPRRPPERGDRLRPGLHRRSCLRPGHRLDLFRRREPRDLLRRTLARRWNLARGRGWCLWKALIIYAGLSANPAGASECQRIIGDVISDHHNAAQGARP